MQFLCLVINLNHYYCCWCCYCICWLQN